MLLVWVRIEACLTPHQIHNRFGHVIAPPHDKVWPSINEKTNMTSYLFDRALGSLSPRTFSIAHTTRLVHALQLAPNVQFDGRDEQRDAQQGKYAHRDGVNSVVADQFEGRM